MTVHQAGFAASLAGFLPPCASFCDLKDYGALLPTAAADDWYRYGSAAQSELTCNGCAAAVPPSRKRGREDDIDLYYEPASLAALLPLPGMQQPPAAMGAVATTSRMAQSAMASTSGRPATTVAASLEDALVAQMCQQDLEIDELVRAGCDRLRAGLEQARKRQRHELARAAASAAARLLRDRDVELDAARRRAAELEERLRQAAAECQAWRDVARGSEAVAAGLRATLETILLGWSGEPAAKVEEGFGDSGEAAAADDAQSCCFAAGDAAAAATASSSGYCDRWACRACGGGEASVVLLPCRHLCLCRACEPLADACPVCLASKCGAIHVASG